MRVVAAALIVGSLVAGPASAQKSETKQAKLSFSFKDLTGKTVSLSNFKGKVILLDFWATWCVPCKQEIPGFIDLQKKYGDRGLQIIGLSVDDSLNMAKEYATKMKMNYPVLLAEGKEDVLKAYDPIPSIPVSIVIDRGGRIVSRHLGIAAMDVFEKEIVPLL
uniref:Thioredoxin-like protein n=1 Tax=uncultured bacterium 70 TaxID=698392 RepID=E3T6K0_9BACT|nr:thioredoxin-like protein [uncultured bacterium 70]